MSEVMQDLLDYLFGAAIVVIVLLTFFALIAIPVAIIGVTTCNATWSDFPHRWGIWTDCMVQVDGKWYPADAVKAVTLKKGSNP